MLAFTTISCISQNGAVAEDAARDDLVAICGPVAQTDERFGHKQWKPLETPPADGIGELEISGIEVTAG